MKIMTGLLIFFFTTLCFAATDSTGLRGTTLQSNEQVVDIVNPQPGPSTGGSANQSIRCGPNQQVVGISEYNFGYGKDPIDNNMPRSVTTIGSYTYIPRCLMNNVTLQCRQSDWVKYYSHVDTLKLVCADANLLWENN
jgi:hypothetical protein